MMNPKSTVIPILAVILFGLFLWIKWPARDIYLSDMDYTVLQAEWAQPSRDTSIEGNPIQMGGKFYTKGIGVHPTSEISVEIPQGYTYFIAEIGVDDEIKEDQPASVIFQVASEGAILYESALLTAPMPPHRVIINVHGLESIKLLVTGGPDGNNADHANWALARFAKG